MDILLQFTARLVAAALLITSPVIYVVAYLALPIACIYSGGRPDLALRVGRETAWDFTRDLVLGSSELLLSRL